MPKSVLVFTLSVAAVVACSEAIVAGPDNGGTYVYMLDSVDSRPLPSVQGQDGAISGPDLSDGTLQLHASGNFIMDVSYVANSAGGPHRTSRTYEGTWTRTDEAVDLEFDSGNIQRAFLDNGALTLDLDGNRYYWVP